MSDEQDLKFPWGKTLAALSIPFALGGIADYYIATGIVDNSSELLQRTFSLTNLAVGLYIGYVSAGFNAFKFREALGTLSMYKTDDSFWPNDIRMASTSFGFMFGTAMGMFAAWGTT